MPHLWSGRFDSSPDTGVFEFGASFRFDHRLFEDDVTGSLAWVEALADAGAIPADEARGIAQALGEILERGRTDPDFLSGSDEDVHSFVERQLVDRLGESGKRLHTGRSRNEQVSLDLRLYLRRRIPLLQRALRTLVAALADRAEAAGSIIMPAYSHLRRAQPILVAHFFLAHVAALRRDHARLGAARAEADALPLGSGALAGTSYAIDVQALASRLGFSRVVLNSLDATGDRDFVAGFLYACAVAMVHLSRLAEDLILFTGEEFAFFELDDRVATGSSLMPQKKNPDPLELTRGKVGRAIGQLTGCLITLKGLPSGYNKDLQEDKEAVFDAESTLAGCLDAMDACVRTLRIDSGQTERASTGFLLATDIVDYLVSRGMPFRTAHELVGGLVRRLLAEGRDLASLSLSEWKAVSELFDEPVLRRVTPRASVEAKRTPQSTHPAAVAAALQELRVWLDEAGA